MRGATSPGIARVWRRSSCTPTRCATFLPAFVNPAHQNVAMQLWALGLWLTAVALLFHAALGFIGAHLRRAAAQASVGHAALQWLHAAVLAGLAAWVIFS